MKRGVQGHYILVSHNEEKVKAFIPDPLPPSPEIFWTETLRNKFNEAHLSLGKLDSAASMLPETSVFLYMYIRKEALLSSQIEGTQSSLSDLLMHEANLETGLPVDDVTEVSSYVAAMEYGLERIAGGFPLSLRLITEIHERLLHKGRGSDKTPGEFRRSQNWVGGSRPGNAVYVPPPADCVLDTLGQLELFLHDKPVASPALLKSALAHVQFETIHPFLDGNGRLGRLLVTLILCEQKLLSQPLLYLSLFLKNHRQDYYDLLTKVRTEGVWEEWLEFFADGVKVTAEQAVDAAKQLSALARRDHALIKDSFGQSAASVLQIHEALLKYPVATAGRLVLDTKLSMATVNKGLALMEKHGLLKEITGKPRNRVFGYMEYMEIISRGTEPL
jgi:Fic family protein